MSATDIKPAAISTRKAAAAYIGCSPDQLEKYEAEGFIQPKAHGSRAVYLVKDLDALLESLPEHTRRRRS